MKKTLKFIGLNNLGAKCYQDDDGRNYVDVSGSGRYGLPTKLCTVTNNDINLDANCPVDFEFEINE